VRVDFAPKVLTTDTVIAPFIAQDVGG
jgi:hypothetical protein